MFFMIFLIKSNQVIIGEKYIYKINERLSIDFQNKLYFTSLHFIYHSKK